MFLETVCWIILVIVAVLVLFFSYVKGEEWVESWVARTNNNRLKVVMVRIPFTIGIGIAALLIFSPLYLEFPSWSDRLYLREPDGTLVERPWGGWDWGKVHVRLPSKKEELGEVTSSVSPITTNPKVRRFTYVLRGEVVDPGRYFSKERRQVSVGGDTIANKEVHMALSYLTYEFNNSQSVALSEFYNPREPAQFKRFRALIEGYFNPRLEKDGIRVIVKSFDVE